jgi:hypothetical protein
MQKRQVLQDLKFGERVAEQESADLASYFVETEQWRQLRRNQVDVIFGPKGSGKSAIYSTLLQREDEFWDENVLLISAENPRGAPVFGALVSDPPSSELELLALWKLYILSLIGSTMADYGLNDPDSKEVLSALVEAKLLPAKNASLATRLRQVVDYVRRRLRIETELKFDATTGMPTGLVGRISMSEPSSDDQAHGLMSVDQLLAAANRGLEANGHGVWVLFDRLDVAFADSRELEANALRALFKCYLDMSDLDQIVLKIFLRSDIWAAITEGGFREASHITRQMNIQWPEASLLNLVVRRLLSNVDLVRHYNVNADAILRDAAEQRSFFNRIVPDQVEAGKARKTFEWLLSRVQDGTKNVAPRELIHVLTEAKNQQMIMLDRGENDPPGEELLAPAAFRLALPVVSKVRLDQTIYAEYPELKKYIVELESEKTDQNPDTLARIWRKPPLSAAGIATRLVEIGFFEERGTNDDPRYWVPFLYRPGLSMIQGAASDYS